MASPTHARTQGYVKGLSRACQGLCQGLVRGLSRACQGLVKSLSRALSRACQGLVKGSVKGLSRACQGLFKGLSRALSRACQGLVKGLSRVGHEPLSPLQDVHNMFWGCPSVLRLGSRACWPPFVWLPCAGGPWHGPWHNSAAAPCPQGHMSCTVVCCVGGTRISQATEARPGAFNEIIVLCVSAAGPLCVCARVRV